MREEKHRELLHDMTELECDYYSIFDYGEMHIIEFVNSKAVDSCEYPFVSNVYKFNEFSVLLSKFDFDSVGEMMRYVKKQISIKVADKKAQKQKQDDLNRLKELGLYSPDKNNYKNFDQWEHDRYVDTGTSNCFFGKYKKITRIKNYIYTINYINPLNDDCFYEESDFCMKIKANDGEEVKLIECIICEGHEFTVGRASYFTAISCVNCGWEKAIHEG